MKRCGDISSDSSDAPIMISFPLIARPPNTAVIAFPLEAVPKITLAPPSLTSSSTLFCDLLSIYCVAPSFLTGSSLSFPREIAMVLKPSWTYEPYGKSIKDKSYRSIKIKV
jgi:hypothetical protein